MRERGNILCLGMATEILNWPVMYHPDNGQRSYKPQTERMILPGSSQKYSQTYLFSRARGSGHETSSDLTCAYCTCAVHMQTHFITLCLWWLCSRCFPNPCQSDIWWLTTARRNSYQPVLVHICCNCAIGENFCFLCTLAPCIVYLSVKAIFLLTDIMQQCRYPKPMFLADIARVLSRILILGRSDGGCGSCKHSPPSSRGDLEASVPNFFLIEPAAAIAHTV